MKGPKPFDTYGAFNNPGWFVGTMVLGSKSPSKHNVMLGRSIPHPSSSRFQDGDDLPAPVAKRLKLSPRATPEAGIQGAHLRLSAQAEDTRDKVSTLDDDNDNDDDLGTAEPPSSAPTDLESTLPPVRTDKEAVAEYEATRAAEASDQDNLHSRLENRKWSRGRNSIYVDAFNLALETVLDEESHLFNEAERAVFDAWRTLAYESQYLYVRLFLRKTAAWHRINRLGYHSDIADVQTAVEDLLERRVLPKTEAPEDYFHPDPEDSSSTSLGNEFTFADDSDEHITTLNEASSLLQLEELKAIAKDARVQGKNKKDLIHALRRQSSSQGGLGYSTLKRSDTNESAQSCVSDASDDWDSQDFRKSRDEHFVRKILSSTGGCIRLSETPHKLFERVHLVFYRSTEWTEKSLTTIILARISRRNFPEYIPCRTTNIFESRSMLLEFEAALRTQFKIDNILEFSGTVTNTGYEKILAIFEDVYPRWKTLLAGELEKEVRLYETGEGAYLRRFSPAWVYTRVVHKALIALARFKQHKREHMLLFELLKQHLFHPSRRGEWYQRKALIEEHYMWALEAYDGRSEELQKKHWKRIALTTCEDGLQDKDCHIKYHHDLQKRIMKLEKSLKVPKRQQHDFNHVRFTKLVERDVEGVRLERSRSTTPAGRHGSQSGAMMKGSKTVWVDEREGGGKCSVEAMCLSWYRDQGWKGYHCEGGLVRTLFGFLFYDVLFTFISNVFQTAYQTCPLDLHTDAFYPTRLSLINQRLAAISNGKAPEIFKEVYAREMARQTCIVGVSWDYEYDDLMEILECFPGPALATVCQVMAQEYQDRGGGVPDLFLWHPENKEIMFSEVKSENDRLSDAQRLWMHVLADAGVKVELCHAVAREVRKV